MDITYIKRRIEDLEQQVAAYSDKKKVNQTDWVIEQINLMKGELKSRRKLLKLLESRTNLEIFTVTVQHPYTNCCDMGSFDKDVYYFSSQDMAKSFEKIMKELSSSPNLVISGYETVVLDNVSLSLLA